MTLERIGGTEYSTTALTFTRDLSEDEWLSVGKSLSATAQGVQFWIGDWINYGVTRGYIPSDRYDLAEEITKMSRGWLQICAWVARSVPAESRQEALSFEHHKRIASLKQSEGRDLLLQEAVKNKWTARELYDVSTAVMSPHDYEVDVETGKIIVNEVPDVELPQIAAPQTPTAQGVDLPIGEVIQLGNHRLIIGDARDPAVLRKLFENEQPASVLWTDPPYGVNYEGKTQESMKIQGDSSDEDDLLELLVLAFNNVSDYIKEGSACYIASGFARLNTFVTALEGVQWRYSTELIWFKDAFAMGWGDYHPQHESIIYAFKGEARRWYGGRDRSTVFGLERQVDGSYAQTIKRPAAAREHPTMKPPRLIFEMLRNSAQAGETVLDCFAGSGSTMIAAQQMGMRAFMVELDPKYAQVIIDRYNEEINP